MGGGAQGPVSQNCTSNPSNSSSVLELSQTLSNPCSPKNELNNPDISAAVLNAQVMAALDAWAKDADPSLVRHLAIQVEWGGTKKTMQAVNSFA